MLGEYWIKCPIYNGKTRVQVFYSTVSRNFPLFCPECKLTHIIDVEKLEIIIKSSEKQKEGCQMKHSPRSTLTEILNDSYGFTYKEMSKVIGEDKARALYTELYKQSFHKKNLSVSTEKVYKSSDTRKYVYELEDNRYIETIFIKRQDGGTAYVSMQVGRSVGCIFCESGRNGFARNLTPSEVVQQVILIHQKVNRIVLMGMGKPLFNYDNLITAIRILRDRNGLNFSTGNITVPTVGPVSQLKKLCEEHLKVQLAISLRAATQAARDCITPHIHMYTIEDVVEQTLSYLQRHNRKVVSTYLLLPGMNDRSPDTRQLTKWFESKNVIINMLQYNPTSSPKIRVPRRQEMVAFKHQLEQAGLEATMRVSHGREIKAACGQLANTYSKAKE